MIDNYFYSLLCCAVLNLLSYHQPHPWEGDIGRGPSRPAAAAAAGAVQQTFI